MAQTAAPPGRRNRNDGSRVDRSRNDRSRIDRSRNGRSAGFAIPAADVRRDKIVLMP
jgi:hypothetical protein